MRRQDTQSTSLVVSLLNANRASETPELVATESVTTAGRGRKRKANNEVKRDSLRKRAERATHKLEVVEAKARKEISQLVEFERTTLGSLVTIHIVCVIPPFPFYSYYLPKTMDNTTSGDVGNERTERHRQGPSSSDQTCHDAMCFAADINERLSWSKCDWAWRAVHKEHQELPQGGGCSHESRQCRSCTRVNCQLDAPVHATSHAPATFGRHFW